MFKLENDEYFLVTGYTSTIFLSLFEIYLRNIPIDRFIFCGRSRPKDMQNSLYIDVDFENIESIKKLNVTLRGKRIKYMFLNHGLLIGKSSLEYSFEELLSTININILSYISILSSLGCSLVDNGSTVLMSSVSAKNGSYDDVYAASKSMIESFIRSYVNKIGLHRVNCVAPGIILNTRMTNVRKDLDNIEKKRLETPLKKLGEPIDVAKAVNFLLSDESIHISGAVLSVDGGI
jgi:NAD(P)-dependent dehydrogenase (short-subunit alcohol dehydrogenase family)